MKVESSWLNKERKKKLCAEAAQIYGKNKYMHEIVNKKKEICAGFAVTPQTVEVTATVSDKCFVKMRKVLNLGVEDMT